MRVPLVEFPNGVMNLFYLLLIAGNVRTESGLHLVDRHEEIEKINRTSRIGQVLDELVAQIRILRLHYICQFYLNYL